MNATKESVDFYLEVFKFNPLLICCLFISILATVLSPLFWYGIIWFERYGSDKRRTLLNMVTSMYCWTTIHFFVFVQSMETARFMYGPLPEFICHLQNIFRFVSIDMFFMCKNCSILTRYVFIVWLKNPAAFKDEFWAVFALIWIQGFSYIVEITTFFFTSPTVTFYICCGTDRPTEQKTQRSLGTHQLIKKYKLKTKRSIDNK
jgi:hypothetical protein